MTSFSFYSPIEKNYHHHDGHGSLWSFGGSSKSLLGDNNCRLENRTSISEPQHQSLFGSSDVQLRFLNPGDYDVVKTLCEQWFPVEYPAQWFEAITSDSNLFSLAAILHGKIIGEC